MDEAKKIFMTSDPAFQAAIRPADAGLKAVPNSVTSAQMEAAKRPGGDRRETINYLSQHAEDRELNELKASVEKRIASLPKYDYWVCRVCGWRSKPLHKPGLEKTPCLSCNRMLRAGGAFMERMSPKEAAKFDADEAENFKRAVEYDHAQEKRLRPVEEHRLLSGDRKW